jgi:hypothetical protein
VSLPARVITLIVAFLAVVAGGIFVVAHYLTAGPPVEDYTVGHAAGQPVNITMQTDAVTTVATVGNHPTWVSYFIKSPQTGAWVHTTLFKVPANTRVNVTILGYDGATPVRNQVWGQVTGTIGGVAYYGRKPVKTVNGWNGPYLLQHTFAIPAINLNVPVEAGPGSCSNAPCTDNQHSTTTFSFMSPPQAGVFRWQCFVPCGLSFLYGNGGPMQTIGYMAGNMTVAS